MATSNSELAIRRKNKKKSAGAHTPYHFIQDIFEDCGTIDPSEVEDAWSRLSTNTWAVEVSVWPLALHAGLLDALRGSKRDGR